MALRVFITGDRSITPVASVMAAEITIHQALEKWGEIGEIQIYTGSSPRGVEAGVRFFGNWVKELGLSVSEIPNEFTDDDGKPDFEKYFEKMRADNLVDAVVFFHADPLSSKIGTHLLAAFGVDDERVLLITPPAPDGVETVETTNEN